MHTLIIIARVARFGFRILKDKIKLYSKLKNINNYIHKQFFTYTFANSTTKVHTRNVESYNNKIKLKIKRMHVLIIINKALFIFLKLFKLNFYKNIL